ncbi:MAG TPA: hypothetical protein VHV75_10155 [Solirubrobacteraceae bacterium]|jgi:hypothetical protein|nr:hypothetical protein [Solirubrobacteraceae bacterium]
MNRAERRALERRLRKIGDQELPSGRIVTVAELYAAALVLCGLGRLDDVLSALEVGTPKVLAGVERVIESALRAAETLGLKAPTSLGESK